jgi:hemin uptake protein HemP
MLLALRFASSGSHEEFGTVAVTNPDSVSIRPGPPCSCNGKCERHKSPAEAASAEAATLMSVGGLRAFDTDQLFAGAKTVVIRHGGESYRLMITRNDRLILQK